VVLLLGYTALGHLPTMLSLSLFVAIVVTLGPHVPGQRDGIWFASGVGLSRFVRPVLRTSWPVLLVVAALLLFVWPWGNRNSLDLRDRYQQRSDLSRVAPGVFQTSSDGKRVFFVERDSTDGVNARNVFVLTQQDKGESVTSARSGRLEPTATTAGWCWSAASATTSTTRRATARCRASSPTACWCASVRRARPRPAAQGMVHAGPAARAHAPQPGRTGLAPRHAAGHANLLLLGIGLAATNPRRAQQLEPAVRAAGLRRVLQPHQPDAGLGRQRPHGPGHGAGRRCTAAPSRLALLLLWWRDHAAVLQAVAVGRRAPA
jgi:lipopolysaccharide export system permease protein